MVVNVNPPDRDVIQSYKIVSGTGKDVFGEPTATPDANTVLGWLKTIAISISDASTGDGEEANVVNQGAPGEAAWLVSDAAVLTALTNALSTVMQRHNGIVTVTIGANQAESEPIDFCMFAMGIVHMPATWDAASLGFKVSSTLDGIYQPLYDDTGNLIQIESNAEQSYVLPAKVAACRYIKLWSHNDGTDVVQTASRVLILDLKA